MVAAAAEARRQAGGGIRFACDRRKLTVCLAVCPAVWQVRCKRAEMTADQFNLFALPKPALALVLGALAREDR